MEFERDYYAILGIASDADEITIKRAYRQLARRYHPDVSDDDQATELFRQIQEAYEILLDPMQREAFDHWRKEHGLEQPLPFVLRVTLSQENLPALAEPQVLYVLVELAASEAVEGERSPMNLCLVLDRSTSMKGARLQQVKEAARYIVDQMDTTDVLSVVAFSDRAQLILPGQPGIDKLAARMAVSNIQSGGGTEILQGLRLGLEEVERWKTPESLSHLLLLTDGQTYGDEEGCLEMARQAAHQQISLTLMGVGSDWNDKLLDEMAELSGAPDAAIYVSSTGKIAQAFHDRIYSLGNLFAHNVTLSVHLGDEMTLTEAFRVAPQVNRLSFLDHKVSLGSLEKQRHQAVILNLLISGRSPGVHRLAQIDVEGIVPALGRELVRAHQVLTMPFDTELGRRAPIPPDIVSAMGKLTIFKMQERTMAEIEMGQIEPAVARLKTMATRLLDIGEVELARAALLEAGRLAQTGTLSAAGRKKIRYGTRGLTIVPKEVRYD